MPDISLLVPLAEQLNVTVAELLQGRRVEEEQRFTREETEDLIRKALTFSAEPPERRQARTKKYLPVYVICCVLGVAEALAVWAAGLADIEGALALLIIGVVFGVVYGAYAMFWMAETLPRYYDENRICNFAQGAFHIHIPGIYYNNRNWKHVLRAFRVWSMASMVLVPPCTAGAVLLERATGWQVWGVVLVVYIASLFGAIVIPAKRFSFPSLRPAYYLAKWEIKNVSSLEKPLRQGGGMRAAGELTSLRQKRPLRQVGEVGKYNIAILFICHFAT